MATIINIRGQKLITGLYWQNLVNTANSKREIVRVGKEAEADLVCVPKVKNPSQAGYITKAELSDNKGIRSLAGGLVESHTGSWLGLFKIPDSDQYYYIGIQNDHILALTDIVGDLAVIQPKFEQNLACGGWHYVIVPDDDRFNYPGSSVKHYTLDEMLVKRRAPKLKRLELKLEDIPVGKIFLAVSLIAAAIIGACTYQNWLEEKRQAEEMRQRLERERAKKAKELVINPPWQTAISVDQFVDTCAIEWGTVRFSISGWTLKGWDCEGPQTIASYAKTPMASSLEFIRVAPVSSLSKDGQQASIITPLATAGKNKGSIPAVRGNLAKATIMDYAERHTMKSVFQPVPPPQVMPGETAPPPPPWTLEKVTLDSAYPPFKLALAIPGLIIKRVSTTKENATWKWRIEGEVYAAK